MFYSSDFFNPQHFLNMKNTLLTIILCLLSFIILNAQSFLVLNNGQKIEYKKFKIKDKLQSIEIKKPKPALIKITDINYLVNDKNEIRYIKDRVNEVSPLQVDWNTTMDPDYAIMEKIVEGKISILNYSTASTHYAGPDGMSTYSNSKTYYFIEKEGVFRQIFTAGLLENKKKNNQNTLSGYFSDDEKILNRINSDDFEANAKNVLDLIREYNVHAYEKASVNTEAELTDAIVFRGYSNQNEKLIAEIELEDQKFSLTKMAYRRIKLLDEKPMKICASNGENELCDLIKGSKYMIKYVEVILKKNGDIDFRIRNKDQYQKFRNELYYQSN